MKNSLKALCVVTIAAAATLGSAGAASAALPTVSTPDTTGVERCVGFEKTGTNDTADVYYPNGTKAVAVGGLYLNNVNSCLHG